MKEFRPKSILNQLKIMAWWQTQNTFICQVILLYWWYIKLSWWNQSERKKFDSWPPSCEDILHVCLHLQYNWFTPSQNQWVVFGGWSLFRTTTS